MYEGVTFAFVVDVPHGLGVSRYFHNEFVLVVRMGGTPKTIVYHGGWTKKFKGNVKGK